MQANGVYIEYPESQAGHVSTSTPFEKIPPNNFTLTTELFYLSKACDLSHIPPEAEGKIVIVTDEFCRIYKKVKTLMDGKVAGLIYVLVRCFYYL